MSTWNQLIEYARRDISDADRCAALSITPAAHQLHRRLRQVTQAMAALLTDDVIERAARAYKVHTRMHAPIEDHEISCEECGWAFDWLERPRDIGDRPRFNGERMNRRMHEHGMRAALTAAIEGEQ